MTWNLYAFHGNDGNPHYLESEADHDDESLRAAWEAAWEEVPADPVSSVLRWGKRTDRVLARLVEAHGFRYPVPRTEA